MKRVTGIGGIFFKCRDPEKIKEWYAKHLGFNTDEYGVTFQNGNDENPAEKTYTVWSPFKERTKYFEPSEKQFMINYRVADLEKLIPVLKEEGVTVVGEIETFDYGKFAHIMDIEGNKIELWEPIEPAFSEMVKGKTT